MPPKTRVCRHCGRRRLVTDFFRNTGVGNGFRPECKPCTLAARSKATKGKQP